jgi:hypothetical protein
MVGRKESRERRTESGGEAKMPKRRGTMVGREESRPFGFAKYAPPSSGGRLLRAKVEESGEQRAVGEAKMPKRRGTMVEREESREWRTESNGGRRNHETTNDDGHTLRYGKTDAEMPKRRGTMQGREPFAKYALPLCRDTRSGRRDILMQFLAVLGDFVRGSAWQAAGIAAPKRGGKQANGPCKGRINLKYLIRLAGSHPGSRI